jgi:glycosyltransferase involved in cell wall biosynthesis
VKVVFVNRFFHPDESATSQILSDLAFDLAARGWAIHVMTSRLRHDDPAAILPALETCRGVTIHRIWTSSFGRGNLAGRAIDYLSFHASAAARLFLRLRRDDIVVAMTDPPMISIAAACVARLRGALLINWLQDVFPEIAERLGVSAARGKPGAVLRWIRNWSLRQARANVVLGERMAQVVRSLVPDRGPTVQVIENWSDGAQVRPVEARVNPVRTEWGLGDRFVVGYSGNLGRVHEFETLLGAFELLREDAGIVLAIIGAGPQRRHVEDEARRRKLDNVVFMPFQPRTRLAESLSVPDVHVITLRPGLEGLVVPSKVYGVAAAGRPAIFIGDPEGEVACVLRRERIGFAVGAEDPAGLATVIRQLRADPSVGRAMGARAREAFEHTWDRPHAVARWTALLGNVAGVTRG